jgi:hypothetical protein
MGASLRSITKPFGHASLENYIMMQPKFSGQVQIRRSFPHFVVKPNFEFRLSQVVGPLTRIINMSDSDTSF